MSHQHTLRFDEDFIESCKDHGQIELIKCYGCRELVDKADTLGGFCSGCVDINEKEEGTRKTDELDKGPGAVTSARGIQSGTGYDRHAL